jgi:hypothetical protein
MRRRYNEYRTTRRRRNRDYKPRSMMMRPGVQLAVLAIVALIVYVILQSGAR